MKLAYAILYTANIEQAVSFYKNNIGLEVLDNSADFASLSLENCMLGIKRACEDREIPGAQTVILSADNLLDIYSRVSSSGIAIVTALNDADWGRNFAIADPDGNKVEFVEESPR